MKEHQKNLIRSQIFSLYGCPELSGKFKVVDFETFHFIDIVLIHNKYVIAH
jgi:hypothetical protein